MIIKGWSVRFLITILAFAACACSKSTASERVTFDPHDGPEVEKAVNLVQDAPQSPAGYTQLASAYLRLCRQTGAVEYNVKAEQAIAQALEIDPTNVAARKLQATLMLSFHQFAAGLEVAEELQKELPDDAFVYGLLVDAYNELGDYEKGVQAAQKMIDLRPNAAAYSRIAHVRSLHGDSRGAVEAFKLAARISDPSDREGQSWCLAQIGNEYWRTGKYAESIRTFDEALLNFPGYYLALAGKGRTLVSMGELASGAELLEEAEAKHLNLDTIFLLGDVYEQLGRTEDAAAKYAFAEGGEATLGAANDPHRVALFWANRGENLEQALAIAQADYANQKDIYASDTLAWCLYRSGKYTEARHYANEAMRLGTADSKLFFHAGMIEKSLGNRPVARRLLEQALRLNPGFDVFGVNEAHKALDQLTADTASTKTAK